MNEKTVARLDQIAEHFFQTSESEFGINSKSPTHGTPNIQKVADINPDALQINSLPVPAGCYLLARVIQEWHEAVRIFPTQNVVSFQSGCRTGHFAISPHWKSNLHNQSWRKGAVFGVGSDPRAEKILAVIFGEVSKFPLDPQEFSWNGLLDAVYEAHPELVDTLLRNLYYTLVIDGHTWRNIQVTTNQRGNVVRFRCGEYTKKEELDFNHKAFFKRMFRKTSAKYNLRLKEVWIQLKQVVAILEGTVTRGEQHITRVWGYKSEDTEERVRFRIPDPSGFWEDSEG